MSEYPYPLYDEKGKVACQICGKAFLTISPQHLKLHNVSFPDYFRRYPNAPKSNKEFAARSKYGKNKSIFKDQETQLIIGDDIFVDEEPEIDELPIQREVERLAKNANPMQATKNRIKQHLMLYFTNVQQDYLVREFGANDGQLKFEFITDFADPVLKVVFFFPDTFWHNRDCIVDLNKNLKLTERGWKVLEIKGRSPSFDNLDEAIKDNY
jgi:hypothetical protein